MVRVKGGTVTSRGHRKVTKMARGYRGARHKQYRRAKEAVLHAGQYAFAGRRLRRRNMRTLWIRRINAALSPYGLTYSRFIPLLKKAEIDLNRKILAQLAVEEPEIFKKIVDKAKSKAK
ncbi:MAG: 50S ribosomal protein L20 [Patescibacteria group bacterium]|nr:MAG: 50S ribosomal protein L20 [Patescibacteria group bacterium]